MHSAALTNILINRNSISSDLSAKSFTRAYIIFIVTSKGYCDIEITSKNNIIKGVGWNTRV